jgi:CheY-like chemotaxis protein
MTKKKPDKASGKRPSSQRVRLIHWKPEQAEAAIDRLRASGYEVDAAPIDAAFLRELRQKPPTAVVIDLSRLPAQGRDVGAAMRQSKSTRDIPIVFVGGEPEKVERFKKLLPDAVYTTWSRIRGSLKRAIASPPAKPVATESALAGYSGTPLAKKLGIKADFTVALVGAPRDFEKNMSDHLPAGVKFRRQARGRCDLVIWFCKSQKELKSRVRALGELAGTGGLWIAWPKQASGVRTDLTQTEVRESGLAVGLVDYKIAAIDATWSGLRFALRKSK